MKNCTNNTFSITRSNLYFAIGLILATYLKIWLSDVYLLRAIYAPHDDLHFVTLASHILNGNWLGSYDEYTQYTLMKGFFYPLWIALSNFFGVPLLTGQHLLYSAASFLFVASLSPLVKHKGWLFIIFLFLIFNPFTLIVDRVFRLGIYPALTIFVIASAFGMYTRVFIENSKPLLWAIGLGLSLSAFWHTREEAIWIIPSLLVLFSFTLLRAWSEKNRNIKYILALYLVPVLIPVFFTLSLATMNWHKYGVFTTLEIHSSEFESAYSGLLRIKTDKWLRYYPVLKEAREKAYAVSPAFAELKPFIEGKSGKKWQGRRPDIPAAFFIWVFRDAVQQAGYYNNYETGDRSSVIRTFEFYQRMGNELQQACTDGRLECASLISPFIPQWNYEYTKLIIPTYFEILKTLVSFDDFKYDRKDLYSNGTFRSLALFSTVTNEILQPDRGRLVEVRPEFYNRTVAVKKVVVKSIWKIFYVYFVPVFFLVFLFLVLARSVYEIVTRKYHSATVLGLTALAAIFSNTVILTLVRITSFNGIDRAMSPAYPVLIIFIVSGFILSSKLISDRVKRNSSP